MTSPDILCRLVAIFIIRMKFHKNKLLTAVAAAALTFAVGACSSSSDDDETAGMTPPATTVPAPDPTTDPVDPTTDPVDPTADPVELAEAAYGEYLEALTAYEVARGVHALTPTAANLAALREAVNKVVTEATDALTLAGAGTAAQLVRAQNAAHATATNSNDVVAIEDAVMAAADLVTALAGAATAATTYDSAKADYEATEGMTQANLDALSNAATAAKEKADEALVLAAGGSAAQLSEAQDAVAAADVAATHASGITMALEAGIADALTAYNTAKTEHATAKTAHDDDASLDNANALKTAADTLLAAAMDADEKGALGGTAEQQTELESVSVTDAAAYVATAGDDVTTEQTAADAAAVVAATAEAVTKTTAIKAEADPTAVDAVFPETVTVDISRDRTATTIEIVAEGDPEFALYKNLGKGRTMHTRKMEADADGDVVEEVIVVSTDIAEPRAVAFAKFETEGGISTQVLDANTDMTNDDAGENKDEATFEALMVEPGADASADVLALIKSDGFKPAEGTTVIHTFAWAQDAVGETPAVEAFETAGTYNGSMGTYRCNGTADCTVTLDAKGAITAIDGSWIFTPAPRVTTDQPDYEYLSYGFWLKKTTDEDGVLTYNEVETFAGSSLDTASDVRLVEGSATYNGGATGVYVKDVHNSDGTLDTATAGHFTAAASLKVNFVGNSVALDDQNSITGTINKFELSGGEENAWSAALKGLIVTPMDGIASGTANGGGAAGTFNATFYGPTPETEADDGTATVAPGSVVGEFDANFSNGSVAGAFGATK